MSFIEYPKVIYLYQVSPTHWDYSFSLSYAPEKIHRKTAKQTNKQTDQLSS